MPSVLQEAEAMMAAREQEVAKKVESLTPEEMAEIQQKIMGDVDPREQSYFMRLDKKTIVRSEKEHEVCVAQHIPMDIVPYSHAVQVLKEEEARHRNKIKARRKKKTARATRKKNR